MLNNFSEKDWNLFREKLPGWQEAYMEKLNKEYVAILTGEGNASDKFWELDKRIHDDKKSYGVIMQCRMSRANRFLILASLLDEGAITLNDLENFSDELKEIAKNM